MTNVGRLIRDIDAWAEVPSILVEIGEQGLAAAVRATRDTENRVEALGADVAPVAGALERAANTPGLETDPPTVMDFATGLRLAAGGDARRGKPLEWTQRNGDWWTALDEGGTRWEVGPTYRGGWGVTVADWDRPDWHADSFEEAKALAEEIVARPKFRPEVRTVEIPSDYWEK